VVGVEDYCALLDRVAGVRAVRADDFEIEMTNEPTTETRRHGGTEKKNNRLVFSLPL
jgi:hypothetical protein